MKATKKLLAMLLGVTLIISMGVSVGATETASTNLLTNPSFEDGLVGWYAQGANNAYYGNTAVQTAYTTDFPAPSEDFGSYFVQYPTGYAISKLTQKVYGLKKGEICLFSGNVHTYHADGTNDTYIHTTYTFFDGNGDIIGSETKERVYTTTGQWTSVEKELLVPAGAESLEIGFCTTNGSSYVRSYDNLSLIKYENLLLNGDFEDADVENKKIDNWAVTNVASATGETVYAFTTDAHTGEKAYAANGWGRIEQTVPAIEETRYKLTYWYKSRDAEAARSSYVRVRFFDVKPETRAINPTVSSEYSKVKSMSALNINSTALLTTDGWQQHVAYFVTPPNTKGISVVLYSYCESGADTKERCIYDDIKLTLAEENVTEFLGFTTNAPQSTGCVPDYNADGSYADEGSYAVDAKNPATTLSYAESIIPNTTIYAAAVAPTEPDAVLIYGMYAENEGVRTLEAVEIVNSEDGLFSAGITVPETGAHMLEVYMLDSVRGLVPIMDPVKMGN